MTNKRFYLLLSLVVLLMANLALLDWWFWQSKNKLNKTELSEIIPQPTTAISSQKETGTECPAACREEIGQLQGAIATLSTETKTVEKPTVEKPTPAQIAPFAKTIYIPLGGNGSSANMNWTDIPGAQVYLNLSDYIGVNQVIWEAALRVKNGNGQAIARLFDVTHSVGVPGSEIYVGTETATTVASSSLVIWSGNNLYRVQLKSLTGYEATLDSARIKITLK